MPYKDMASIKRIFRKKINDDLIWKWADSLQPHQTSKLLYMLHFWLWARKPKRVKGQRQARAAKEGGYWDSSREMLDDYTRCKKSGDPDLEFRHLNIVKEYVKGKGTSPSDRMNAMGAVKAFYRKYNRPLQDLDEEARLEVYAPTSADTRRKVELSRVLTPVDVAIMVRGARMPYKAIFMLMFEAALDASAFVQFNSRLWRDKDSFDLKDLEGRGPVKIGGIVRSKTSFRAASRGGEITVYYSYFGEDAKRLLREWLLIRKQMLKKAGVKEFDYLFFNWRRGGPQQFKSGLAPVTGHLLRKNLTDTIKRLNLVQVPPKSERSSRTRYYIHGHELRDCFGSMCTPAGVNKVAREFFMGHPIDRLGYDKSPFDPQYFDFYKGEYRKVARQLDVLSNPPTGEAKSLRKETLALINKQHALLGHVPREVVEKRSEEEWAAMSLEEVDRLVKQYDRGARSSTETDGNGWEPGQQKVVAAVSLREWVERGWRYVDSIPSTGEVVIRYPDNSS